MTLDARFQFTSHWAFNNRESFQAVIWQKILAGITANSDGRTGAFYSIYLTLDRDNPGIGLIHFVRKILSIQATDKHHVQHMTVTYIVYIYYAKKETPHSIIKNIVC